MPTRLCFLAALAFAPAVAAQTAPAPTPPPTAPSTPFPTSLEEAARLFDPTKAPSSPPPTTTPPVTIPPVTPTTTLPPPVRAVAGEPAVVMGWRLVESLSERRSAQDGSPTKDACGYERDVMVERRRDAKVQSTAATLIVPCTKGADGLPAPGPPLLRLPAAYQTEMPPLARKGIVLGVDVDGPGLAVVDVAAVVVDHEAELLACNSAGPGKLVVNATLSPAGAVSTASAAEGSLAGTAGATCLLAAVRTWMFPPPADDAPLPITLTVQLVPAAPPVAMAPTTPTTPTSTTPATSTTPTAPVCKPGETPKAAEALAVGELPCVPPAKEPRARPCRPDEHPKAPAELKPDELACKVEHSDRGVPFLKGELTHLGDVQLVNARTSFGVGLGLTAIDNVYFAVVRPDLNLKFGQFSLGLGAPLRFEVANLQRIDLTAGDPLDGIFGNAGRFRTEDWDQIEDFVRPLRYVTYGKKEDNVYVDINRVHASTIGHGQLVRRYAPNLDIDEDNIFANVDGYGDYGGVELMAGPFPLPRLLGGLAFIKPMAILNAITPLTTPGSYGDMVAESWSIGVSYVTDLNSPTGLNTRFNPADQRLQLVVDAANQLVWNNKVNPIGDVVQGFGIDTELKLLKTDNIDIKVYADYSRLLFPADTSDNQSFAAFSGGGGAVGGLMRVSFGEKPVRPIEEEEEDVRAGRKPREKKAAHAFRLRLEGRAFEPTYLPSYWNTMYEVDRFQFGFAENRAFLPTKIGYLASKINAPLRAGYYVEAAYAWVDAVGVSASFEDAYPLGDDDIIRAKNLALHVESQGLGWLQLFATYHFRNFDAANAGSIFSFETDNEILYAGARLQILPIMFVNVAAQRSFRLGFDDDDTPGTPDDKGNRFTSVGLQNVWAGGFDVELGWQF
jgi:hypothetical protein